MLTKKDFKKVAEILNFKLKLQKRCLENAFGDEARNLEGALSMIEELTESFVKWFKSENPKFDETKFREAVYKK